MKKSERKVTIILGIIGGIGSGKSSVARLFHEEGCPTLDADLIGHEILGNKKIRSQIRQRFGDDVFDEVGVVSRPRLAEKVFVDSQELSALNDITQPLIREKIIKQIDEHIKKSKRKMTISPETILVLDVSLLASSPLKDQCDEIVFVQASDAFRLKRCRERGWTAEEMKRREQFQMPLALKKEMAQWVVNNSGPLEKTRKQVHEILLNLQKLGRQNCNEANTASSSSSKMS